ACALTDHSVPFPHAPLFHQSIHNVRISLRKVLDRFRRCAAKNEHCAIHRIGQRAAEQEFAAIKSGASMLQMKLAELRTPFHIIVNHVIEQDGMHGSSSQTAILPEMSA